MTDDDTYPLVRFVSEMSEDLTSRVRFDFHVPGVSWTDPNEWQWTPGGLLGDPDSINPEYGFGRLDFNLYLQTSHADAVRVMSDLGRELRRGGNFLLFQFDQFSDPGWLEVFASSPGALGFPYAKPDCDENVWVIPVSLTTSATVAGAVISHDVTVVNNPAVPNGQAVLLPEILGDAPSPLVVEIPLSVSESIAPLLSVAALDGVDSPGVTFWQAESFTLGAGASVVAAGSSFSGASRARITLPASAANAVRLSGTVAPELAGTYRLFARVVTDALTGTGAFILSAGGGAQTVPAPEKSYAFGIVNTALFDLGTYSWPRFNPPLRRPYAIGPSGSDVTISARSTFTAERYLDVDYIVAIPVDLPLDAVSLRTLSYDGITAGTSALVVSIDGEVERTHARTAAGVLESMTVSQGVGSYPVVVPGMDNLLHFLSRRTSIAGESVTSSVTMTVTYRPRRVWLP